MPAWSVARRSKVWLPSASAGESVSGEVQVVQLPPSMRHSKVEPVSLELKREARGGVVGRVVGLEVIVLFGAVRSIVQV